MDEKRSISEMMKTEHTDILLSTLESMTKEELTEVDEAGQTLLHLAVFNKQLAVVALLLSKGSNPNQKNNTMLSPFIAAAANGFSEIFGLILEYQPDLTESNRFGGTALLPSSEKGFIRVVQQSLDAGVPVNHINRLGWTALLEAVILGDDGFLFRDIVEELMVFDADPYIKDFDSKSAIGYTSETETTSIGELLLKEITETSFTEVKKMIRSNQTYPAIAKLLTMDTTLEQLYYLGFSYECLGHYETAAYYYKKGLEQDPQFAYYLANLTKAMGNSEQALAYFDEGARKDSKRAFFIYHKSNYLRELGKHPEAIEAMDELLSSDPNRVDYMFHKANSLRSLGELQAAYDLMIQADLLQPANSLFKEQAEQIKMEIKNMEDTDNG